MNKMNNKSKIKVYISIILTIILIVLSTILAMNVDAVYQAENSTSEDEILWGMWIRKSTHQFKWDLSAFYATSTPGEGVQMGFEDLDENYDILCCEKGRELHSKSSYLASSIVYGTTYGNYTGTQLQALSGEELAKLYNLTSYQISNLEDLYGISDGDKRYSVPRYFADGGVQKADAEEAYILAEMELAAGQGEANYVQEAWWNSNASDNAQLSSYKSADGQAFSQEAKEFAKYIEEAGGGACGSNNYTSDKFKSIDTNKYANEGETVDIDTAFDIKYEPKWNDTDIKVRYSEVDDSYIVGPYSIDYIDYYCQFGNRPAVQFAGIVDDINDSKAPMKGMQLFSNSGELTYKTDWELLYDDTSRSSTSGVYTEYPRANEEFYLVIHNQENLTKITNVKVNFRYMNAYGSFQKIKGYKAIMTWYSDYEQTRIEPSKRYRAWLYFDIEIDPSGRTQELAIGMEGATWYKYTSLDKNCNVKNAALTVRKEVVDDDGEIIEDTDAQFEFKLNVTGAYNSGEETLTLSNQESKNSRVYYWYEDEDAPTYTISEVNVPEGYKCLTENMSGTLSEDNNANVEVTFKNSLVKPGKLEIIKNSEDKMLQGKTYNFNVTITSINKFKVNGETHKAGESVVVPVSITSDDGSKATIECTWYGETAPTYEIVEVDSSDVKECVIDIPSGRFVEDQTITATAENKVQFQKGAIEVIKTFDATNKYLTEDMINNFVFKVKIHVDDVTLANGNVLKYGDTTVQLLYKGIIDGKYTWSYTTGEYTWVDKAPHYTIEEVEVPEGTENVSITPNEGELVAGSTVKSEATITSEVINKLTSDNGHLEIVKYVDTQDMLQNTYKFAVIISGTFTYDGKDYINQTVQVLNDGSLISAYVTVENGKEVIHKISNDEYLNDGIEASKVLIPYYDDATGKTNETYTAISGVEHLVKISVTAEENTSLNTCGKGNWTSKDFTWYGNNAPKYNVKENIVGEDYKATVVPSEGSLKGNNVATVVDAVNRDNAPYAGYLRIIKTIDKDTTDLSLDYINSLKFTFKVSVTGFDTKEITLDKSDMVYENGKYSWVWESDAYTWKKDAETPKYTIEEIVASDMNGEYEGAGVVAQDKELQKADVKEEKIFTEETVLNKIKEKQGKIVIQKDITNKILEGEEFSFKVYLKGKYTADRAIESDEKGEFIRLTVNLANGNTAEATIKWFGEAPTYEVVEEDSDIAKCDEIVNGTGTIQNVTKCDTVVTVSNSPIVDSGYIKITKNLTNSDIADQTVYDNEFKFKVTFDGDVDEYKKEPFYVIVKAGETWTSEKIEWYHKTPIKYTVEEVDVTGANFKGVTVTPSDGSQVSGQTVTGTLSTDGQSIELKYDNELQEHSGKFNIVKSVFVDKLADPSQTFPIRYTISSKADFMVNGQSYKAGTQYVSEYINFTDGQTVTGPEVKWFGDVAPIVTVEENVPVGYTQTNISNNGAALIDDGTITIEVTNKPNVIVEINLMVKLSGIAFIDQAADEKNTEASKLNSIYDQGLDKLKAGVEVYIYDNSTGALAEVYNGVNGQKISQPIVTNVDGKWEAGAVKFKQGSKYNIVFMYDGETYETVQSLVEGSAADYVSSSCTNRAKYFDNSFAADVGSAENSYEEGFTRTLLNERLATITGGNAMNGNGQTIGYDAKGNALQYETGVKLSEVDGSSEKRVRSKLITTNENGIALDEFKVSASTNAIGVNYLLDGVAADQRMLTNITVDKIKDINSIRYNYTYHAVYKYAQNINIGLREREPEDVSAVKDLVSAKATVNGKEYDYASMVNKLSLAQRLSNVKTLQVEKDNDPTWNEYKIGLYSTDYYYRAEIYAANNNYDEIISSKAAKAQDEMEIVMEYQIALFNDGVYTTTINAVDDYANANLIITDSPAYTVGGNYVGSDGETYTKYTYNDLGITLAPGESTTISVKVKVDKGIIDGIQDAIAIGNKSNVAEIASYSTTEGKVDQDSAPANINIQNYNETGYYEDDTDKITVNIELSNDIADNTVKGLAWEDKKTNDSNGDGIYDKNDEYVIGGLTTELVEKITTDSGKVIDAIWTTSEPLDVYGGKTLKELTGFDSTTETLREGEIGSYTFSKVPTGIFAARFEYGNNKAEVLDTDDVTEQEISYIVTNADGSTETKQAKVNDAMAYDKDGNIAYVYNDENKQTFTANYEKYYTGYVASVYNGQDYKATVYTAKNAEDANKVSSNVLDNEARRLDVIANSELITNYNNTVMYSANYPLVDHTDLYNDYYMFADSETVEFDYSQNSNTATFNAGFVERPVNNIVLDKEIQSIKLTDNTGTVIFDAEYDISYDVVTSFSADNKKVIANIGNGIIGNKYLVANVTLATDRSISTDVMQAIDKVENKLQTSRPTGEENFRFINVDEDVLQGTTISIDYKFTALNVGEKDYLTNTLNSVINSKEVNGQAYASTKDAIQELAKVAKADFSGNYSYLGNFYKVGSVDSDVTDVTSRVRQLIDYIDTDAIFNKALNSESNKAWATTSVGELSGNGDKEARLVAPEVSAAYELEDANGMQYIQQASNNIVLSVDDINSTYTTTDGIVNNNDFEKALYAYEQNGTNPYTSSMSLVVTKTVSSEDDADTLSFENIAEIVKMENSVGRRDVATLVGNVNPTVDDIFAEAAQERDQSATELVTFTPPTGIQAQSFMSLQIALVVIISLGVVCVGIVIIKKTVLK